MVKPSQEKNPQSESVLDIKTNSDDIPTSLNDSDVQSSVSSGQVQLKKMEKRRLTKYAILLGYQGKNYFGMQLQPNPNQPTIESHLLRSLNKLDLITEEESKAPQKVFFQRAARTDRGVSAVRQMCSIQLPLNLELVEKGPELLNEHLPNDIRVLAIRRATPTFNSQKSCDSRTYSYTLPTFAFAESDKLTNASYRINDERIKDVNGVLAAYLGTKNFFNYTSGKAFSEASCKRYIMSFVCDRPFLYRDPLRNQDVEFMSIYIKGQSFMLHQIRKMIGMTIAVVRGCAPISAIQKSFEDKRLDVPKAPGLGLLLEQVHYAKYDSKYAHTHANLDTWGDELEAKIRHLRDELIVSEIMKTECQNNSMLMWLTTLSNHTFTCDGDNVANGIKMETEESSNNGDAKPENLTVSPDISTGQKINESSDNS